MKEGSTLFLKVLIYLMGLAALGVSVIIAGVTLSGNAGTHLPILLVVALTVIPFLYALYGGLSLLGYIDNNTAFSESSVHALKRIHHSALAISAIYAAGMPFIIRIAQQDDAPGAALIGLLCIMAPLVVAVFVAVLHKLLQNALDIKSENDLTV